MEWYENGISEMEWYGNGILGVEFWKLNGMVWEWNFKMEWKWDFGNGRNLKFQKWHFGISEVEF